MTKGIETEQCREGKSPIAKADPHPGLKILLAAAALLAICFIQPLFELTRFALKSDLYSYLLLVPFVSAWLLWLRRNRLLVEDKPDRRWAVPLFAIGTILLAAYWAGASAGVPASRNDALALAILALLFFVWGAYVFALGPRAFRSMAFPLLFLVFMVPMPSFLEAGAERLLQAGSAEATYILLSLSGTPVLREGTVFQLPGFSFDVAPQCSGIHSTVALFLSALLAGHLFLRKPKSKALLAGAVLFIGVFRNAARIFILAQLCVHVSPDIIHSNLHRRGGPLFFALSLIPFFLLIWLLIKWERRQRAAAPMTNN